MNEQELNQLRGRLRMAAQALTEDGAHSLAQAVNVALDSLALPVPEPDHSMCARLEQRGVRIGSADGPLDPSLTWWELVAPDGDTIVRFTDDDAVRRHGYAIPEPEPTVVERAAKVLAPYWWDDMRPPTAVAQALADAGLLVRDGEQ